MKRPRITYGSTAFAGIVRLVILFHQDLQPPHVLLLESGYRLAHDGGLDDPASGKDIVSLGHRRTRHHGPAVGAHFDNTLAGKPVERLAHHGTADLENVAQ